MKNNDQEEYREDEIGRSLGELNGHCTGDCAKPVIRNLSEMGGFFISHHTKLNLCAYPLLAYRVSKGSAHI